MKFYKRFVKEPGIHDYRIELQYSIWQLLAFHPCWFCRVWQKNWTFGQSYGRNKFEAYRLAFKDLKPV